MAAGQAIPSYETRGRGNYRNGKHRTMVYKHLPSQAGVHVINKLPKGRKNAAAPNII
ncbi:hypothetical protein J6590_040363 [Homalodisca vitripennis]|nr:hypothetical protein J6590_040363 [Homalodisca vitripennis]